MCGPLPVCTNSFLSGGDMAMAMDTMSETELGEGGPPVAPQFGRDAGRLLRRLRRGLPRGGGAHEAQPVKAGVLVDHVTDILAALRPQLVGPGELERKVVGAYRRVVRVGRRGAPNRVQPQPQKCEVLLALLIRSHERPW